MCKKRSTREAVVVSSSRQTDSQDAKIVDARLGALASGAC